MMETTLELRHVSFRYGDRAVLDDVDLEIASGEMVGLLGPNGSGKTTLLKIADGLLRPGQGEVHLGDSRLRDIGRREIARRIGWVPQDLEGLFAYSVLEIVSMGRFAHLGPWESETDHDRRIVEESLIATDAQAFRDRYLNELSGGERQRVFLARALAQEPEILLLDEPTSFLDLKHRLEIYALLSKLARERRLSVVAASHDLQLIAQFCDRLVLLRQGRVAAVGAPREVLTPEILGEIFETRVEVEWRDDQPLLVWK